MIVVRYKPAGNRAGLFQENVSPLSTGAQISDHTPSGSSDEDIEIDNARVGTLIQTDTDSVETVDDQGKQVKIVTKTEKYLIEQNGIKLLR